LRHGVFQYSLHEVTTFKARKCHDSVSHFELH